MTSDSSGPAAFRFSLRMLLVFVVFIAVSCSALKFAGETWWLVFSSITLLAFLGIAVAALVCRGSAQAFALGCSVCVAVYGFLLVQAPIESSFTNQSIEMDPYEGHLPTTRLTRYAFELMVSRMWIDSMTGDDLPDYEPPMPDAESGLGPGGGGFGGVMGPDGQIISPMMRETPAREQFMPIAHVIWLWILGLFGGSLGRILYAKRIRAAPDSA